MRIALKQDVALPADAAFAAATDFAELERAALRRGIRVARSDHLPSPGKGSEWEVAFRFRGRQRLVRTTLAALDPPRQAVFQGRSDHLDIGLVLTAIPLTRDRSRLAVEIDIRPRTLRARVMIQSARLARGRIENRIMQRLQSYAERIAQRPR